MKSPLSIFNFSTLKIKISNVLNSVLLIVLIGYLCAELLVRYFVPDDQYPTGHWRNNELKVQTSQLEKLDNVDVMFSGSSLCSVNIPPKEFDDEMKKNGINTVSFNAGIRGCDYEGIAEGFKELFWSRNKSEYVVLVVSPYDLDESNNFVRNRSRSFIKTFNTPIYEAAVIDLLSNSWLFGFRHEIKDFFKTCEWKYEYPLVGERGNTPMYREANLKILDRPLDINKQDTVSSALFNLVDFLINQDKKVIIIEGLGVSEAYEKVYPPINDKFYNLFNDLDQKNNTYVIDVRDIIPDDIYFIDVGHLSVAGAKIYARNLAKKLIEAASPLEQSSKAAF